MPEVAVTDPAKWPLVASLSDAWKARLSTFRHLHNTLYFTTFDRRVFARGANDQGLLGVGHREPIDEPVELPELSNQDVIDFNGGVDFRVALTKLGRVYTWNGQDIIPRPRQLEGLPGAFASIKCGAQYAVGLTKENHLYVWGDFNGQRLPTPTRVGSEDFQVGRILSTVPNLIVVKPDNVSLYECGPLKAIQLERDVESYDITSVEAYLKVNQNKSAFAVNYEYPEETFYIESDTFTNNINSKTVHYAGAMKKPLPPNSRITNIEFGQLVDQCTDRLILVDDTKKIMIQQNDAFADLTETNLANAIGLYGKYKISPSMLSICKSKEGAHPWIANLWVEKIADSFDRPENADIVFKFDALTIHAHRYFLSIISEYMHTRLSDKWLDQSPVEVTEYSYAQYYRYLRYLYTGKVNVSNVKELVDLYDLANSHLETGLQKYCFDELNDRLNIDTACQIFEFTIKYDLPEFTEKVVKLIKSNMASISTKFVKEMSNDMTKELLVWIFELEVDN